MLKIANPQSELFLSELPRDPYRKSYNINDDELRITSSFQSYVYPNNRNNIQFENKINEKSRNNPKKENQKETQKAELNPKEGTKIIKIRKKKDYISFFIRARGQKPKFYEEKKDTKIGIVIEDYIKEIKGKPELKFTFTYEDNIIDNLDKSIRELNIQNLSFVISNENLINQCI